MTMTRSTVPSLALTCVFCLATACHRGQVTRSVLPDALSLVVNEVENPAPPLSAFPNLTAAPDGSSVLSWIETSGGQEKALRFAVRRGGNWSPVNRIRVSQSFNRHPAVLPAVAMLTDAAFVSYWTEDVYASASRDGGKNWTEPVIVHGDRSESEHSLVSMAPLGSDKAAIVWLDGREEAKSERSMLVEATFDTNGVAGPESILDPDVCSCCPTSIERTSDGLFVAYRDRDKTDHGDIRDISILRFAAGKWSEPRSLNRDGWRLNGCPSNGVDTAVNRSRIAVAWFTSADDRARVKLAFSDDGGGTFAAPIQIDEGHPIGRASVALLANGVALVSWVEKADSKINLMVRGVAPDGRISQAVILASDGANGIGYPRIRPAGDQAMIAWVAVQGTKKVRTAMIATKQEAEVARK
jgi:hypothetical protein